jgi:hypothetical protein
MAYWSYHMLDNDNYHSQAKEIETVMGAIQAKKIPHPNGNSLIV